MQNLPAQSVTAPEKVRCLRNNTPNHTLTDLKTRQSSKIREIGEALISTGFVSLDSQAKILGLPRSTAWTILAAESCAGC
jgi:aspartokinase